MGLLDVAQSASNSAASTISGPVDMLAWLLKRAGLDVGEPVGGSDWMKRKGFTKDVAPGASQVVGETLGLLSPAVVSAKAPQIASGLLKAAENAAAPRTLNPQTGAVVWHGSPHKFDKFDSSKIGTGEGAQAYGHGLYFAQSKPVAEEYAGKLSRNLVATIDGVPFAKSRLADNPLAASLVDDAMNRARAMQHDARLSPGLDLFRKYANEIPRAKDMHEGWGFSAKILPKHTDEQAANITARSAVAKDLLKSFNIDDGSSLYKVDLPDSAIARMLDWDKPLADQSAHVAGQLERAGMYAPLSRMSHGTLWHDISSLISEKRGSITKNLKRDQAAAADEMRKMGIPGIRYLDGGSRGAGAGTSNYVVFPGEENLLTILERNGAALR